MATQVRETSAGKSISAWVILNKKGVHVATVNAHYSNGGRVSVDVWNIGAASVGNSFAIARANGRIGDADLAKLISKAPDYYKTDESRIEWAAWESMGLQQSAAGGYGYDKLAAALSGLVIDGHTMADHCGQVPEAEKARAALMRQYCKAMASGDNVKARRHWDDKAARIGCSFANCSTEKARFDSLYFTSGLDRLRVLGYQVIQAI